MIESLRHYRQIVGDAWEILLRKLPKNPKLAFESIQSRDEERHRETLGLLSYRSIENHQAKLPMVFLAPKEANGQRSEG